MAVACGLFSVWHHQTCKRPPAFWFFYFSSTVLFIVHHHMDECSNVSVWAIACVKFSLYCITYMLCLQWVISWECVRSWTLVLNKGDNRMMVWPPSTKQCEILSVDLCKYKVLLLPFMWRKVKAWSCAGQQTNSSMRQSCSCHDSSAHWVKSGHALWSYPSHHPYCQHQSHMHTVHRDSCSQRADKQAQTQTLRSAHSCDTGTYLCAPSPSTPCTSYIILNHFPHVVTVHAPVCSQCVCVSGRLCDKKRLTSSQDIMADSFIPVTTDEHLSSMKRTGRFHQLKLVTLF